MALGTGLATALTAVKGHAVAAAVIGTLIVGSGAAAVVATGAVHLPTARSQQQTSHGGATETARATEAATAHTAAACAASGDTQRLVNAFAPMFDSKDSAQQSICSLFVGSGGHTLGFGEVQQALEITAAIEENGGSTACLAGTVAHGQGGTPAQGKPTSTPGSGGGQPNFIAPTSTTATTMGLVKQVLDAVQHGTPLARLAQNCGAGHVTGNPGSGTTGQPTGTPGAKPTGTPGAKPTGTPGHP